MKLIAHRGNVNGPDVNRENSPDYIVEAIEKGFDVEVDVWIIDDIIYLGHDEPQYKIDESFIEYISEKSWFHCKNLNALKYFVKHWRHKYFWHEEDKFTLTSNNIIWTYPGQETSVNSIIVILDREQSINFNEKIFGICSDYVSIIPRYW